MKLSEATPQDMAAELMNRGVEFILVATESEGVNVYSPHRVPIETDDKSGGLFKLIRDYLDFLETEGGG